MNELLVEGWDDYELVDSGDGQRLERIGQFFVVRPDPNVLWPPSSPDHEGWEKPDALFVGGDRGSEWVVRRGEMENGWSIKWNSITLKMRLTPFRHVGVFPEQEANWKWLQETIKASKTSSPKILNLFAYTGASSLVASAAGAHVTHVDASKGTVHWAAENAELSGLSNIRWIVDDVLKFAEREIRRGTKYDLILMDPPVFGRGPKGEIWRLEEKMGALLEATKELLSEKPLGVLINMYSTSLYPESIARLANDTLGKKGVHLSVLALCIQESSSKKSLQTGFVLRS